MATEVTLNQNYRAQTNANSAVSYTDVHNKSPGNSAAGNPYGLLARQDAWFPSGSYVRWNIHRPFLYWDTSAIPSGAEVIDAEIQIYVTHNYTYRTHNIVVQNGQPAYPTNPINTTSYYYSLYSGDGGSIASSTISTNAWNTITLNDDGKNWINCGGETKLALRVSRDIDSDSPGTPGEGASAREEGIRLDGDPIGGIYAKLVITYVEITTDAASEIGYQCAMGNGTINVGEPTERGFEIRLDFGGTLNDYIQHSIADFEGEASYSTDNYAWEGTLTKTESETGTFSTGAYELVLGYPSVLGNPSSVFNDKLFKCESYTYRAFMVIDDTTYYGDYVAFSTLCDTGEAQQPTDDISEGNPVVPIIPIVPIEPIELLPGYPPIYLPGYPPAYPPFIWEPPAMEWQFPELPEFPPWNINLPELPPWDMNLPELPPWDTNLPELPPWDINLPEFPPWNINLPDLPPWIYWDFPKLPPLPPWVLPDLPPWEYPDYPPLSFVGDFYYRKPYTKKDLDELRKKCIIFNKNSVELALVLRHNINVLREFFNMMTEYLSTDEFNRFKDIIPTQHLKELYLDPLKLNDFRDMINNFIRNAISNNTNINHNFKLIEEGLSDYETESDDAYFREVNTSVKTITEDNSDVDRLKNVIDNLNQEASSNFSTIMYNLKIVKARLL